MIQAYLQHIVVTIVTLNFLYLLFLSRKISNIQSLIEAASSRALETEKDNEQDIHVDLHNRLLQIQRNRYARGYSRK